MVVYRFSVTIYNCERALTGFGDPGGNPVVANFGEQHIVTSIGSIFLVLLILISDHKSILMRFLTDMFILDIFVVRP